MDEESSLGVGEKKWKLVEINIVLGQSIVFLNEELEFNEVCQRSEVCE